MQIIQIGANISKLRKEKGITQEELAEYLGVSKPAVSKWESGQSYPDILLLPVIASYFNQSVDELLGYAAQMSAEDVQKLYIQLADAFATEPFDAVYARCKEIVKKYYSCWKLLFSIAQLWVNHAPQAGRPDRINALYEEAAALFERVERESEDTVLARLALSMRAYCAIAQQRPAEAIDLLGEIEELPIATDQLLAKAYAMKGETGKAKDVLQKYLYQNVLALFGAFTDLIGLYIDEPERIDVCLQKALDLGKTFDLEEIQPASYFTVYLTAAAVYTSIGKNEQAIKLLEAYTELLNRAGIFPLKLKGNAFFDRLEPYFSTLNLGTHPPRSNTLIKKDLRSTVTNNPAFQNLQSEERFQRVVRRLKHWEENNK